MVWKPSSKLLFFKYKMLQLVMIHNTKTGYKDWNTGSILTPFNHTEL